MRVKRKKEGCWGAAGTDFDFWCERDPMTAARLAMATALATQPDRDPAGGAATNISLYLSKCLVFYEGGRN